MHKPFTTEMCIKFKRFCWNTEFRLFFDEHKSDGITKQPKEFFSRWNSLLRWYYILFHKAQQINFFSWHFNHVWSLTYNNKSNSHTQPKIEMSVFSGRMSYDLFELPHSTIICLLLYWIELMYFLMICCRKSGNDNQT